MHVCKHAHMHVFLHVFVSMLGHTCTSLHVVCMDACMSHRLQTNYRKIFVRLVELHLAQMYIFSI